MAWRDLAGDGAPDVPVRAVESPLDSERFGMRVDRLTVAGWVTRQPHPVDRRSLVIVATPGADEEVRHTLDAMHRRMLEAASELDERQAEIVKSFLGRMSSALEDLDRSDSTS